LRCGFIRRLMQSVLGLACMLMGSAKEADPGGSIQGRAEVQVEKTVMPRRVPVEVRPRRRGRSNKAAGVAAH
jgi:hypothetical protein